MFTCILSSMCRFRDPSPTSHKLMIKGNNHNSRIVYCCMPLKHGAAPLNVCNLLFNPRALTSNKPVQFNLKGNMF